MTVCIMPLSAQRSCCANEREPERGRYQTAEERHIIASFTRSQPTSHAFRHRQAVPIGAPLVNKNHRPGCTIFSLSSSPPLSSPSFLSFASCLFFSPLSYISASLSPSVFFPQSIKFPIFPSRFGLSSTPKFPFIRALPLSLFPRPSLVPTSNQAGNRAVSLGVDAAAEYQIEGKTWRQKKRGREREKGAAQ